VTLSQPNSAATAVFGRPCAQASTILERNASACDDEGRRTAPPLQRLPLLPGPKSPPPRYVPEGGLAYRRY